MVSGLLMVAKVQSGISHSSLNVSSLKINILTTGYFVVIRFCGALLKFLHVKMRENITSHLLPFSGLYCRVFSPYNPSIISAFMTVISSLSIHSEWVLL